LERGKLADKAMICNKVKGQVLQMSKHKFASNVVEKCVAFGSKKDRYILIEEVLTSKPDGYVLHKCSAALNPAMLSPNIGYLLEHTLL
jgi:hypothetical protein